MLLTMLAHTLKKVSFFLLCCFTALSAFSQANVTTQHFDAGRTGWYNKEVLLNKKNVTATKFGKLFARAVDDQVYAQPLVKLKLAIPGKGNKNVVFVATVNNSVYAFDADSANVSNPYWQVNLTAANCRVVNKADMTGACGGYYNDFSGNMGIVGTPVIDTTTNSMYLVARSLNTSTNQYYQYLHVLDITTGAEKTGSPVLINASVVGNGDGSSSGFVHFDAQHQNQRGGLLLLNGVVYIAWSSHCDWGPYHGWIMGYDKTSLQQKYVYNTTPNGYNGGIWMSGGGPSADSAGFIYAGVGNGSVGYNGNPADPINRSETALKLTSQLKLNSFFTPKNYEVLEGADLDFGVTQFMLVPNAKRGIVGVKDGHLYLLNTDNMGGYSSVTDNVAQTIDLGSNAFLRSALSFYKGTAHEYIYSWSENSLLRAYPYIRATGKIDEANTVVSGIQGPVGNNGAQLAVSSNGAVDSTAVLWASYAANGDANQSVRPGILRALDATNVTKELWNSGDDVEDDPGNYAKFNCPAIANGKVYLGTFSNQLVVYGLRNKAALTDSCDNVNLALNQYAYASSIETGDYTAYQAVDGNLNTRWSSQFADPQWLTVDLGKTYNLCRVVLHWEVALGLEFKIQLSNDGTNWMDAAHINNNASYKNTIPINGSARYVRMYGIQRGTPYGYSLYEMEVYGKKAVTCAAPDSLYKSDVYGNSAVLHWRSTGVAKYVVQYKTVTAADWQQATADTTLLSIANLACNTPYQFRVKAVCAVGDSSVFSATEAFTTLACEVNCDPLPTRWSTEDAGNPEFSGAACYNSATSTFELKGYGIDIGGTADQFRYAFKTLVGNGEIKVRITDLDNVGPDNKFGIMIRESLAPGAKMAFLGLTSGNGTVFITRSATDAVSTATYSSNTIKAPYWLKIKFAGSVYTAYTSKDGLTWNQLGQPTDAAFGNGLPLYEGLAITSHNEDVASTGHADNYTLGGVLPIKLVSFTGHISFKNTVALQWITTLESNMRYFIIERTNGNNYYYNSLDTVYAENGGDYTETYNYTDAHPYQGMNYYRLKIVDKDGHYSYSPIVAIRLTAVKAPSIYPNPANSFVNIVEGSEPVKQVNIYTVMGRPVIRFENKGTGGTLRLPVYGVSTGIYFVEIRTANGVYQDKLLIHN